MIPSLTPEELVKHGIEGYTALARCVILRAIQDYKIGVKYGYIENGKTTEKLRTALARERRKKRMCDESVAIFRLEANTAAEDYASAISFIHGGALETMLDLSWKEVKPDYVKEKLLRDETSRRKVRNVAY